MTIFDLFSKRQRRARGEVPELFVYDELPDAFRVQIVHLLRQALPSDFYRTELIYNHVHQALCLEYGLFQLGPPSSNRYDLISTTERLFNFILNLDTAVARVLDAVELLFREAEQAYADARSVIDELNERFREHGVGYQFHSGEIIRMDSTLLHQDAVKPTLVLLHDPAYANAETEFLRAHDHYRHGRYEEALTDALKAMESTLKIICHGRKWVFNERDTAKKLLDVVFSNDLVPPYLQNHFNALRSTLESGVPTIRNKESGHGAGTTARDVPPHLAAYTLHLTASAILLLAECDAALPQLP